MSARPGAASSKFVAVPRRVSMIVVVLIGLLLVLPVVRIAAQTVGESGAMRTIGLVLAEAAFLYVGYGSITRVAGPAVRGRLVGD